MIVGARLEGQHEKALAIGWNAEAFARTKRLEGLGEYLKPKPTVQDKRAKGAAAVAAMLKRLEMKGDSASR